MRSKPHLPRSGLILCLLAGSVLATPKPEPAPLDPQLTTLSPLGATKGDPAQIQVRGKRLQDVHTVWFECHDLSARIQGITQIEETEQEEGDKYYRKKARALLGQDREELEFQVTLKLETSEETRQGLHHFRLVSPQGLSNSLSVQIVGLAVKTEIETPHVRPSQAQILEPPTIINGSVSQKGELDYYSFEVEAGKTLSFQVLSGFELGVNYWAQTEVRIYEPHQSWFGTEQAKPLILEGPKLSWEPITMRSPWFDRRDFLAHFVLYPGLQHRFEKAGRYLVSVGAFLGRAANHDYQLRITPVDASSRHSVDAFAQPAHSDPTDWLERDASTLRQLGSFRRRLGEGRLEQLRARSVDTQPPEEQKETALFRSISEKEPNRLPVEIREISIPGLAEGRIDLPGDIDHFKIQTTPGQALAFEIETPHLSPPHFSPWLKVLNAEGKVIVQNIFREYGGNGIDPNRYLERKTIHTFQEGGEYTVLIRDATDTASGEAYAYRLLVRPQIPHVGRMDVSLGVFSVSSQLIEMTDRLNMRPGETQKLTLVADLEEGFSGELSVQVENLPPGLRVYASTPASWSHLLVQGIQYRPPGVELMDPSTHRPRRQAVTLLLETNSEVDPSSLPRFLEVTARPMVSGELGPTLSAGRIPLMILVPEQNLTTKTAPKDKVALAK